MSLAPSFPLRCDYSDHSADAAVSTPREYVCIWESAKMPGVLQLGRSQASPEKADWILESALGATRFRVTYCLQTRQAAAVERRIRAALDADGVLAHDGFYLTQRRFVAQMLQAEAEHPGQLFDLGQKRSRSSTWTTLMPCLLLCLGAAWLALPAAKKAVPAAPAPVAVAKAAPAPASELPAALTAKAEVPKEETPRTYSSPARLTPRPLFRQAETTPPPAVAELTEPAVAAEEQQAAPALVKPLLRSRAELSLR